MPLVWSVKLVVVLLMFGVYGLPLLLVMLTDGADWATLPLAVLTFPLQLHALACGTVVSSTVVCSAT